ncbi:FecR family protein [Geothrix oryzisoli]|uniref:FecR family protein n=1 Tax=Geothrix oryzisoli TaxID=2922721 RepID=UPI001FAC9CA5|nr:FecR family protein [Geothrix oryzisoli]
MNATFTHSRLAAVLLLPAALVSAAPQAPADDETYQGEAPERYAMVRVLEGDVRIHKGDLDESLSRGTPIAEGDVVESRGRGVLQLGDGTRIAFGGATRFTVAALFTNQKGEKQVLLRLDYGRLRVLLGGQSEARFRVDTPSGTATCLDKGAFTIEAERDRVVRLKVHSGRVTFSNERDENRIVAGERLTVYSPQDNLDRVRGFNTYEGDDFDRWSEQAVVIRRGESWDRVPAEIRYYADDLDGHGRWVQSSEFGWVWQPDGVAEDWRPYCEGRWAPYSGGMTWISDEPWAYVAYHHGRWHWSLGVGWFWIPGIYYSPAWVAWNYTPGYYGWAPLGYYNTPCHWGYGAWGGGYAWNVVSVNYINVGNVRRHIYSDGTVIRSFNGATGATTWTGGGGRDLRAPWQRSPLVVSQAEFRNPGQMQSAFQRDVNRQRLAAYERQAQATTGRTIIRREAAPVSAPTAARPGTPAAGPARIPFENRGRAQGADRPAAPAPASPRERGFEDRPRDRARELPSPQDRKADPAPRTRGVEPRGQVEDRRPDPAPRERPVEPRPRVDERRADPAPQERRYEPAPRERAPEPRPRVEREERRPDPTPRPAERESRPAPRVDPPREERREERRESAPESRPAPAPTRPSGGEGRGGGREIRR